MAEHLDSIFDTEKDRPTDPRKIQEHFEDFYEDIFEELSKFGEIEDLNVCDNLADRMFREEDQAAAAHTALQGHFYSGRPIIVDFSPVTDFREACFRQYEENCCNRGRRKRGEEEDMKGMMMEESVGMVVVLQGVQGTRSGRAARNAVPRSNSGTVDDSIVSLRRTVIGVAMTLLAFCESIIHLGILLFPSCYDLIDLVF
uniref:RRM domain-containing protein n=1 Tax=Oryza brachyantha TaxID=4533 RepID=J3L2P8_ORYBR